MRTFYVIVKEEFQKQCFACNGTGKKTTSMQGQKFTKACSLCGGKGFTSGNRTTEVPLEEALKEIGKWDIRDNGDIKDYGDLWSGRVDDVVDMVCIQFGVERAKLLSRTREREMVDLRFMLFWFCRERFGLSYNRIGNLLGGFDHATVLWGHKQVENLIVNDREFSAKFFEFKQLLERVV